MGSACSEGFCGPAENAEAAFALTLMKEHISSATWKSFAKALADADVGIKQRLEEISAAHRRQEPQPIILREPPSQLELGAGRLTLMCEAFSFAPEPLRYQWCKDGAPLPRAERPCFVLLGAEPRDEGSYTCCVSAGAHAASTRKCEVRLAAGVAASQAHFDGLLSRADEAEVRGDVESALALLSEAAVAVI